MVVEVAATATVTVESRHAELRAPAGRQTRRRARRLPLAAITTQYHTFSFLTESQNRDQARACAVDRRTPRALPLLATHAPNGRPRRGSGGVELARGSTSTVTRPLAFIDPSGADAKG